jgi:predicted O-methyltransferase YrrM
MRYRWHAALDRLPENRKVRVAEIGVWTGTMSVKLLEGNPLLRLIQIDRWQQYTEDEQQREKFTNFSLKKQNSFDMAKFKNQKRTEKYSKRIRLIELDSIAASQFIKDRSLDMVFLDAQKSYDACRADIIVYLEKIKRGGWIGGHDYPNRIGVKQAIETIFNVRKIEADQDKTWWVRVK